VAKGPRRADDRAKPTSRWIKSPAPQRAGMEVVEIRHDSFQPARVSQAHPQARRRPGRRPTPPAKWQQHGRPHAPAIVVYMRMHGRPEQLYVSGYDDRIAGRVGRRELRALVRRQRRPPSPRSRAADEGQPKSATLYTYSTTTFKSPLDYDAMRSLRDCSACDPPPARGGWPPAPQRSPRKTPPPTWSRDPPQTKNDKPKTLSYHFRTGSCPHVISASRASAPCAL